MFEWIPQKSGLFQNLFRNSPLFIYRQHRTNLVVEVTLQETGKCTAVSCLVLCHFVYRVVDGIQVQLLCLCCQSLLACAGKKALAAKAKQLNLDAIHDTVHEMAKDEARHGCAFAGFLKRYFND